TVFPWVFAMLPTPLLKVVMQAWPASETCARAGAVAPQRDARAMTATTWRAVRCSAMLAPPRQGWPMRGDRPGGGVLKHTPSRRFKRKSNVDGGNTSFGVEGHEAEFRPR